MSRLRASGRGAQRRTTLTTVDTLRPAAVAVTVTLRLREVAALAAVKLAALAPACTVTLVGTASKLGFDELRLTTWPLAPAAPLSRTVPLADWPPTTFVGTMAGWSRWPRTGAGR